MYHVFNFYAVFINLLDTANNGHKLAEHVLVLVLVVHGDAGEENVVSRMGVDPAHQNYVLPEQERQLAKKYNNSRSYLFQYT